MATGMRRHQTFVRAVTFTAAVGYLAVLAAAQSPDTPRRGGVLLAAIGADAPSLDPHQEQTFATVQPVAPLYSTLLQIDPYSYPNVIGDVASEWKISPDGLTYTFKIHQDIRFHDGSPLTAADVKASHESRPVTTRSSFLPKGSAASGSITTRRWRAWKPRIQAPSCSS
jgi:ABC-type transport system substrate-binding protein